MVAAWINADTGVGPAIASGNHVCKGNCALFPIAPINKKMAMVVSIEGDKEAIFPWLNNST